MRCCPGGSHGKPISDKVEQDAGGVRCGYCIGNETYGKDSRVYLYCPDLETRTKLEYFLFGKGCEVGRDYSPGYNVTEVRVSYFKGNNWDE